MPPATCPPHDLFSATTSVRLIVAALALFALIVVPGPVRAQTPSAAADDDTPEAGPLDDDELATIAGVLEWPESGARWAALHRLWRARPGQLPIPQLVGILTDETRGMNLHAAAHLERLEAPERRREAAKLVAALFPAPGKAGPVVARLLAAFNAHLDDTVREAALAVLTRSIDAVSGKSRTDLTAALHRQMEPLAAVVAFGNGETADAFVAYLSDKAVAGVDRYLGGTLERLLRHLAGHGEPMVPFLSRLLTIGELIPAGAVDDIGTILAKAGPTGRVALLRHLHATLIDDLKPAADGGPPALYGSDSVVAIGIGKQLRAGVGRPAPAVVESIREYLRGDPASPNESAWRGLLLSVMGAEPGWVPELVAVARVHPDPVAREAAEQSLAALAGWAQAWWHDRCSAGRRGPVSDSALPTLATNIDPERSPELADAVVVALRDRLASDAPTVDDGRVLRALAELCPADKAVAEKIWAWLDGERGIRRRRAAGSTG
jgi:hypothetical protein